MFKIIFAFFVFIVTAITFEVRAEITEISGFVSFENGSYYFLPSGENSRLALQPMNQGALNALKRLKAKDYIYGKGEQTQQREMHLFGIEFVGLRALLGNWKAQQGAIFSFVDFKHAQVASAGGEHVMEMNYAISPSNDSWKVFFSNENEVSLGNLTLSGRNAVIEFFDHETGAPTHKVLMNKMDK